MAMTLKRGGQFIFPVEREMRLRKTGGRRGDMDVEVELNFRDIKTTMGMDHLFCKTPVMIEREILMHMIAYNLVRALMLEAAQDSGDEPTHASFAAGMDCASNMARILTASTDSRTVARRLGFFKTDDRLEKDVQSQERSRVEANHSLIWSELGMNTLNIRESQHENCALS